VPPLDLTHQKQVVTEVTPSTLRDGGRLNGCGFGWPNPWRLRRGAWIVGSLMRAASCGGVVSLGHTPTTRGTLSCGAVPMVWIVPLLSAGGAALGRAHIARGGCLASVRQHSRGTSWRATCAQSS
jgi:hypothetical protein